MRDERVVKLANSLVNYSVDVQKGEIVRIIGSGFETKPLVKELVKEVYRAGGYPYVEFSDEEVSALVYEDTSVEWAKQYAKWEMQKVTDMDAIIYVRALTNDYSKSKIPQDNFSIVSKETKEVDRIRVSERKWVLLNYPTHAYAKNAKMTYDDFFDFSIEAMTVDYKKMKEAYKPLKELMEKTDKVRIVGPGTDIEFSIKGIDAIPCSGEQNIPDGEIFTAPVIDSVNGQITYNTPSPYRGQIFENICFKFKDGKIIEATCEVGDNEELNKILDTDEGARFIGEFAIGVNPLITKPMGDILYDEKIAGSIHFTPGAAYEGEADNGNRSVVHWDIVLIQTNEYGGGEIYFDDVLVRKDGLFVLDELKPLNPENLK